MSTLKNNKSWVAFSLMMLATITVNAQIGLPGDGSGDVGDTPAAVIDGLLGISLLVGSYLGFKKLKK